MDAPADRLITLPERRSPTIPPSRGSVSREGDCPAPAVSLMTCLPPVIS
jgi:hypothetical protein